jgi:hypothetical protein
MRPVRLGCAQCGPGCRCGQGFGATVIDTTGLDEMGASDILSGNVFPGVLDLSQPFDLSSLVGSPPTPAASGSPGGPAGISGVPASAWLIGGGALALLLAVALAPHHVRR